MNRSSKDSSFNGSLITASNGNGSLATRISTGGSGGTSLMNGNGQIVYRRSPIPNQQQHQPSSFDTLSIPTSYNSEEISETINSFEDDDSNISDLNQRFEQLQRQIEVLTLTQTTQDERYKRSRQENDALLSRVHGLEDQLRELEFSSEARAKEDEKRFKEAMARQVKVQSLECEQHLHANFLLQQELFKLKNDLIKSEALVKTLRSEKETLESELQEKNSELISTDEELHKLKLLVKSLKDEENVKSNIISILNEELEVSQTRSQRELHQQFNDSIDVGSSSGNSFHAGHNQSSPKLRSTSSRRSSVTSGYGDEFNLSSANTNTALANNKALKDIDGLEVSLSKVREENSRLREENEELQAQLLNFQLEEGRSLVQEGNKSYSLADELGDIDVQRLMKALKEQQDDNARLRKYMDDILLKIVDKNPEILDRTMSSTS